jgi:hypothetical protein
MAGLWFEEFTDGMVFNHEWSRTITETDNVWFSLLTMNVQPLHIDAHYAAKTEWGKPLVNSLFTLGLMIGMSVNDTTFGTSRHRDLLKRRKAPTGEGARSRSYDKLSLGFRMGKGGRELGGRRRRPCRRSRRQGHLAAIDRSRASRR